MQEEEDAAAAALSLASLHVRGGGVPQDTLMSHVEDCIRKAQAYEDELAQAVALSVMDLDSMQARAADAAALDAMLADGPPLSMDDALAEELLSWFKLDFFSWVDNPACALCGYASTAPQQTVGPSLEEAQYVASRTEVYSCPLCGTLTRFPRYNDPIKLLETRKGRCGEWANAFALICRAAGLDVRLVYDSTDHVWVEYYSTEQGRWIHLDPCEGVADKPLLYEQGWGKQLVYCIGVGRQGVADVTQRYTKDFAAVLRRRNVDAAWLAGYLKHTNERLRAGMPELAVKELEARDAADAAAMAAACAAPLSAEDCALPGRQTGSAEWVAARSEGGSSGNKPSAPAGPKATRYRWARDEGQAAQQAQRVWGGVVRASGENRPSETADKAFDGIATTKWLDFEGKKHDTAWLEYRLLPAADPVVLQRYALISANDAPERDPRHVVLEAWEESMQEWVTIDVQHDVAFAERGQCLEFEVSARQPAGGTGGEDGHAVSSRRFRLRIVSVADPNAANSVQLAGWELFKCLESEEGTAS